MIDFGTDDPTSHLSCPGHVTGSTTEMPRVLLTEGEQRATLAVARSLGRAGLDISVTSATGRSIAGASRYVDQDIQVPHVGSEPARHLSKVSKIVSSHAIDVLVPMTDASASVLLSLRESHTELTIPLPPSDTWMAATDKASLVELAGSLGIPVPGQIVVHDPDDTAWKTWASTRYPVIVKPHRSVIFDGTSLLGGPVGIAYDEASGVERLHQLPRACFPVLVQERIVGPGQGAFFLSDDGRTTASFAHERIREKPPTGGVSVLRRAVPIQEDIREYSERLLDELGWSGVAMVEFKRDEKTGTPYLMEINGRFWGSLQLAIDAGVDFPRLLLAQTGLAQLGPEQADENDGATRLGIQTRWLLGDLDHLIWMLKAPAWKRDEYALGSRASALLRFLLPQHHGTRLEVLKTDDARPFVREAIQWGQALVGRDR